MDSTLEQLKQEGEPPSDQGMEPHEGHADCHETGADEVEGGGVQQIPQVPADDQSSNLIQPMVNFQESAGLNKRARKHAMSRAEIEQALANLQPPLNTRAQEKLRKAMCASGVSGNSQCAFFDHYEVHNEAVLEKLSRDTIKFLCFARGVPTHKKGHVMVKKLVGGEVSEEDRGVDHNWSPSDYARLLLTLATPELRGDIDAMIEMLTGSEQQSAHNNNSSNFDEKRLIPWKRITQAFFDPEFRPSNPLSSPEVLYHQRGFEERGDLNQRRKCQDDLNKLVPSTTNWYRSNISFGDGANPALLVKVAKLIKKKWFAINLAVKHIKQKHMLAENYVPDTEWMYLNNCGVNGSAGLFAVKLLELAEYDFLKRLGELEINWSDPSSIKPTPVVKPISNDESMKKVEELEIISILFEKLERNRDILALNFDEFKHKLSPTTQLAFDDLEDARSKIRALVYELFPLPKNDQDPNPTTSL